MSSTRVSIRLKPSSALLAMVQRSCSCRKEVSCRQMLPVFSSQFNKLAVFLRLGAASWATLAFLSNKESDGRLTG
jgi:hypothetical protein